MIRLQHRPRGGHGGLAARVLLALASAVASQATPAQTDAQRARAAPCAACHGEQGRSALADIPSLAGQPKQFITTQLVMFREGNRKNPVMNALAEKLLCTQCHGPDLHGQQHIPRLAGQRADYLRAQLLGFKAQTRFDMDGNMTAAAQALTAADIEALAPYLASLR